MEDRSKERNSDFDRTGQQFLISRRSLYLTERIQNNFLTSPQALGRYTP